MARVNSGTYPSESRCLNVGAAKEIFDQFDFDGDGKLDTDEIMALLVEMYTRMGKKWIGKYTDRMHQEVEAAIKQFDVDGNGTIEFGEFLKMVVCKPWSTILPLARPAGSFATCARELFSEADADGDGFLNEAELVRVVILLFECLGKPWLNKYEKRIAREVRSATLRFDANGDGCLDFGEFQQMLQTKPWVVLIPPPEEQGETISSPNVLDTEDPEALSQHVLQCAHRAFSAADVDGNEAIDKSELASLLMQLWEDLGVPHSNPQSEQFVNTIDAVFHQYDTDDNGVIDFTEFVSILAHPPWLLLLPSHAQDKFSNLITEVLSPASTVRVTEEVVAASRKSAPNIDTSPKAVQQPENFASMIANRHGLTVGAASSPVDSALMKRKVQTQSGTDLAEQGTARDYATHISMRHGLDTQAASSPLGEALHQRKKQIQKSPPLSANLGLSEGLEGLDLGVEALVADTSSVSDKVANAKAMFEKTRASVQAAAASGALGVQELACLGVPSRDRNSIAGTSPTRDRPCSPLLTQRDDSIATHESTIRIFQVGHVTVRPGVAMPPNPDALTFITESLQLGSLSSLLQLNCGPGAIGAAAAAKGVARVVVTDRSPLAVSNALSNAKNLAGYLGGVQGVVCKAPSTDLLGEQFDMVYIDYCSSVLETKNLATFSKTGKIHIGVISHQQADALACCEGWTIDQAASSDRGDGVQVICLSRNA